MEAIYMRESKRHHWRLQAVKFENGMELAKALEKQARENGFDVTYGVAIGVEGYADWPQSFKGTPYLFQYVPKAY